ncbi:MAG: hypothetical protein D6B28_04280 [Gammaproteobacteria bacterium]|nr:MAG: hypothetical protein D6B28_04280 [Gammaproteobacteria bacterium]
MQKGNLAAYKYEDSKTSKKIPSLIINWKWGLPALLIFILLAALPIYSFGLNPGTLFLTVAVIVVSSVVFYALNSRNEVVIVSTDYFFLGGRVYLYRNIKRAIKDASLLVLEMSDGRCCKIECEKFPTGARKDWKIEKNKKEKYEKVANKILEKVKSQNPQAPVKENG